MTASLIGRKENFSSDAGVGGESRWMRIRRAELQGFLATRQRISEESGLRRDSDAACGCGRKGHCEGRQGELRGMQRQAENRVNYASPPADDIAEALSASGAAKR